MTRHHRLAFLVPSLLACVTSARADLVIDDFANRQTAMVVPGVTYAPFSGTTNPGGLGGDRKIEILNTDRADLSADPDVQAIASSNSTLHRFQFSSQNSPPANPTQFSLVYDGTTSQGLNATGLGGVDATEKGLDTGIRFASSNTTDSFLDVTLTAYTDATHASSATVRVPSGAAELPEFVPFANFSPVAGESAANFASLGALSVVVNYEGLQGSSGSLDNLGFSAPVTVNSVPEPSITVLAAVGLAAALGRRAWGKRRAGRLASV